MRATAVAGLCLAAALGCAASPDDHRLFGCTTDLDCEDDRRCYRGFCVRVEGSTCSPDGVIAPCYEGPAGTLGIGACRAGSALCEQGMLGACEGWVASSVETCNGADDDCDGTIDELEDGSCVSPLPGACAAGRLTCRGSVPVCDALEEPRRETCDAVDEDCDGRIDESLRPDCYPVGQPGCSRRADGTWNCLGACAPGTVLCTDGALGPCSGATVPSVAPDACTPPGTTATDDDCDGRVDEDCACTEGESRACYGGAPETIGVGICRAGTQRCTAGRFGACEGDLVPDAETCANDGADDDCDGVPDDVSMRGEPCTDEVGLGRCRRGSFECAAESLSCVTPVPRAETCDGLDDDCDGAVDEGFDLLNDPANCGSCGAACGAGLRCCGGACVDLSRDARHCTVCGGACGAERICCGSCIDPSGDRAHCGGCGVSCGSEEACCGASCVDTRTDESHCGECGMACAVGEACCGGVCRSPTSAECTGCASGCGVGELCCGGRCANTDADRSHCGGCGIACGAGELCCSGRCVAEGPADCGGCGIACGGSDLCCAGRCVPRDASNCDACGVVCSAGSACCASGCADTSWDSAHCGGCGISCSPLQACSAGICCSSTQTNCGGTCFDLTSDPRNCGSCGRDCFMDECRDGRCCDPFSGFCT